MGRGRTTTGMIVASLIATIAKEDMDSTDVDDPEDSQDYVQGIAAENEQYLNGRFC